MRHRGRIRPDHRRPRFILLPKVRPLQEVPSLPRHHRRRARMRPRNRWLPEANPGRAHLLAIVPRRCLPSQGFMQFHVGHRSLHLRQLICCRVAHASFNLSPPFIFPLKKPREIVNRETRSSSIRLRSLVRKGRLRFEVGALINIQHIQIKPSVFVLYFFSFCDRQRKNVFFLMDFFSNNKNQVSKK